MRNRFLPVVGGGFLLTWIWASPLLASTGPTQVLLLADAATLGTDALVAALENSGSQVTVVQPEYTWDGTNPPLSGFDVVVHLNGATSSVPLPVPAQVALEDFVRAGGGFLGSQWNGFEQAVGQQANMPNLVLQQWPHPDNCTGCNMTWTQVVGQESHPVLNGVPASFSFFADAHDAGPQVQFPLFPSTVVMRSPGGGPAVTVREWEQGRIVTFSLAPNFSTDISLQDFNILTLYVNAVGWVSEALEPEPTVPTNYRSIGRRWHSLYREGRASVVAGSNLVTFAGGSGLPMNVGRGDRLLLKVETGHDQNHEKSKKSHKKHYRWEVFYLLSRESDTEVTIQGEAGETLTDVRFKIRRAYRHLQHWENARDGNLVGDERREVGILYNDRPFDGKHFGHAMVTIDGSETDTTYYMALTVAEGHRHNGTAGTGVVLDGRDRVHHGIVVRDDFTRIEGLELKRFGHSSHAAAIEVGKHHGGRNVLLSDLLIHDFYSKKHSVVGIRGEDDSDFTLRNSIVYDGDAAAVWTRKGGTALIENCTIFGMSGRGLYEDKGTFNVVNTISMKNGHDDFQVSRGSQSHNLSSDGSADGPGSLTHRSAASQFFSITPGSEDFHLLPGSDAKNAGESRSDFFTLDIDGDERLGLWDIGADEIP